MTLRDVVEATEVGKTRGTNVTPVRPLTTIADNVNTHLALRGLDGGVCLARGHSVTLGVEQEVVDESLHVLLHSCAGWRRNLVVLDADGTSRHLVQALVNDPERLAELGHTAQVAVVAVAIGTDGNVKLYLVVGIVGLALADIPWDTGSTEHDTSKGQVQGLGSGDDTDTTKTLDPHTVVRQHLLGLVDSVTELSGPLVDIVEQASGNILVDTARSNVCGVHASARDTLVEFLETQQSVFDLSAPVRHVTDHQLLALLEAPQERRQRTNIHGVGQDSHQVVEDAGQFAEERSNPLGTIGNVDVEELLDGEGEALLVGHHGDVIQPVEIRESLEIGLVLDQLLGSAVKQTDVRVCADNFLSIEFKNQTQHTVGGRVLGTKVDGIMADLAILDRVVAGLPGGLGVGAGKTVDILGAAKVIVDGDELGAHGLSGGVLAEGGRRERLCGERSRAQTEPLGSSAGEAADGGHLDGM